MRTLKNIGGRILLVVVGTVIIGLSEPRVIESFFLCAGVISVSFLLSWVLD